MAPSGGASTEIDIACRSPETSAGAKRRSSSFVSARLELGVSIASGRDSGALGEEAFDPTRPYGRGEAEGGRGGPERVAGCAEQESAEGGADDVAELP